MSVSRRLWEVEGLYGRVSPLPPAISAGIAPVNAPPGGVSWCHPPTYVPRIDRNLQEVSCLAVALGRKLCGKEAIAHSTSGIPPLPAAETDPTYFHVYHPPNSCSVDRDRWSPHAAIAECCPQGKRGGGKELWQILLWRNCASFPWRLLQSPVTGRIKLALTLFLWHGTVTL